MDMDNKDRQKKFRESRKGEGLIRIELWVKPAWRQKIMELLKQLKGK